MTVQEPSTLNVHDAPRAGHLLMLEFGDRKDFDDPKLEYRRLFSELLGTFFLVLVILCALREGPRAAAWVGGAALAALTLIGFPLTGAALNPARWFGPVFLESISVEHPGRAWADTLVYLAGPIFGALLAGLVCFRMSRPAAGTSEVRSTKTEVRSTEKKK